MDIYGNETYQRGQNLARGGEEECDEIRGLRTCASNQLILFAFPRP